MPASNTKRKPAARKSKQEEAWAVSLLNREVARLAGREFVFSQDSRQHHWESPSKSSSGLGPHGESPEPTLSYQRLCHALTAAPLPERAARAIQEEFALQLLFHHFVEAAFKEEAISRPTHVYKYKELRSLLSCYTLRRQLVEETGLLQGNVAFWESATTDESPQYPSLSRYWETITTPWWSESPAFTALPSLCSRGATARLHTCLSRCTAFSEALVSDYRVFLASESPLPLCDTDRCVCSDLVNEGDTREISGHKAQLRHPFCMPPFATIVQELGRRCHRGAETFVDGDIRRLIRGMTHQAFLNIVGPFLRLSGLWGTGKFGQKTRECIEAFLAVRLEEEALRFCVDNSMRSSRRFAPISTSFVMPSDMEMGWKYVPREEIRVNCSALESGPPMLRDAEEAKLLETSGAIRFVRGILIRLAALDDVSCSILRRGLLVVPLSHDRLKDQPHFSQFICTVRDEGPCEEDPPPLAVTSGDPSVLEKIKLSRTEQGDYHKACELLTSAGTSPTLPLYYDPFPSALTSHYVGERSGKLLEVPVGGRLGKLLHLRPLLMMLGDVIFNEDLAEVLGRTAESETRTKMQKAYSHAVGTELATLGGWARMLSAYVAPEGKRLCQTLDGHVREVMLRTDALLRIEQELDCRVQVYTGVPRSDSHRTLADIVSGAMLAALSTFATRGFEMNSSTEYGTAVSRWWEDPEVARASAEEAWHEWRLATMLGKERPNFQALFTKWRDLGRSVPTVTIESSLDSIRVQEVKPTGYGPRLLLCAYEEALLNALKYCDAAHQGECQVCLGANVQREDVVLSIENTIAIKQGVGKRRSSDRTGLNFITRVCKRVLGCKRAGDFECGENSDRTRFVVKARCKLHDA